MASTLDPFFKPRSVALIGVSRDMDKFNGIILKNLLGLNYEGDVYLVNPHATTIMGIKVHASIKELPSVPELGVILHSDVVPVLENCGKKGILNVIIQADISLRDEEAQKDLCDRISDTAEKYGIRFIGPSLIGLINFPGNFTTSIIPVRDRMARLGNNSQRAGIGFLAQSGGLAGGCGWWNPSQEVSFSKVVHVRGDFPGAITDGEFLDYLVADEQTRVISLFLREINESLIEKVKANSTKKPILFKKCGKQVGVHKLIAAGALQVDSYNDLFEVAKAFIFSPLPRGNRIGLIGPSSGAIDVVLNEFKKNGLQLAKPSPIVREQLVKLLRHKPPARCNPVDYWPPPRFFGHEVGTVHHEAADFLLSDEGVDALFLVLEFFHEIEFDVMIFKDLVEKYPEKPIMGTLIQVEQDGENRALEAATRLKIPLFKEPERLTKAYSLMLAFWKNQQEGRWRT